MHRPHTWLPYTACRKVKAMEMMLGDALKLAEPELQLLKKAHDPQAFVRLKDSITEWVVVGAWSLPVLTRELCCPCACQQQQSKLNASLGVFLSGCTKKQRPGEACNTY